MQEEYVELIPEGLTRGVSLQEAYFLIFKEKNGQRHLPTLVDEEEYAAFRLALNEHKYPLIKMMSRLAHRFDIRLESVHVFYPPKGGMSATLIYSNGERTEKMACNIAEGVTAATYNHCPILMKRESFEDQMRRQKSDNQASMPIASMSNKLLDEALKAAVAEENFELASVLRDEIRQREIIADNDQ